MRLSCCPISPLKSELGSTGTVSPSDLLLRPELIPDVSYRLGIPGRLVPSSNRFLFRRLYLHCPTVPPKIGVRWEMASGQSGLPTTSPCPFTFTQIKISQKIHEVIGSPPNVAVPTHFAKVVLASKPSSPATPDISEISLGACALPNAVL